MVPSKMFWDWCSTLCAIILAMKTLSYIQLRISLLITLPDRLAYTLLSSKAVRWILVLCPGHLISLENNSFFCLISWTGVGICWIHMFSVIYSFWWTWKYCKPELRCPIKSSWIKLLSTFYRFLYIVFYLLAYCVMCISSLD